MAQLGLNCMQILDQIIKKYFEFYFNINQPSGEYQHIYRKYKYGFLTRYNFYVIDRERLDDKSIIEC